MKALVPSKELPAYLRKLAAASMLVVSMTSPMFEIATTAKSTYEMATMVECCGELLGDAPYMIESRKSDDPQDLPTPELTYSGYAFAITIRAKLARSGVAIGGHNALREALANYEYLQFDKHDPADMVTSLLIKIPTEPSELEKLKALLMNTTIWFAIDDGSGFYHLGNSMMGNGIYLS